MKRLVVSVILPVAVIAGLWLHHLILLQRYCAICGESHATVKIGLEYVHSRCLEEFKVD